jgi:GNAT superfamily N-acetyltransferase
MGIEIIRAGPEHTAQLLPLLAMYRQFYEQAADAVAEKAYLEQRMLNGECVVFLATNAGQPAGFVLLYPTFDSVMLGKVWVLHDLYVCAGNRRMGLARRLMETAHDFCRSTGASRIDLATAITNTLAQPLYESMGYERDTGFYFYSLDL